MKVTRNEAKEIILNAVKIQSFEMVTLENAYNRVLYEAIFTMTGSIIPENADTAIKIEDAKINEDEIIIEKAPKKGDLIDLAGSEIKKDEIILHQGEVLDYKKVSLLANLGFYQIKVYTRPSIGIIVTGNEIQEPWEQSYKAGVKNVNFYILKGMLELFADIVYLGKVKDEPSSMNKLFASALKQNDILLSSAGASKGKYDFTKDIAKNIGLDVIAEEILKSKENRVDFIRVTLSYKNGKIFAKNASSQQTSNFLSTSESDALVIVDENQGNIKEGEVTEAILI